MARRPDIRALTESPARTPEVAHEASHDTLTASIERDQEQLRTKPRGTTRTRSLPLAACSTYRLPGLTPSTGPPGDVESEPYGATTTDGWSNPASTGRHTTRSGGSGSISKPACVLQSRVVYFGGPRVVRPIRFDSSHPTDYRGSGGLPLYCTPGPRRPSRPTVDYRGSGTSQPLVHHSSGRNGIPSSNMGVLLLRAGTMDY